jgi:hypothetical protein
LEKRENRFCLEARRVRGESDGAEDREGGKK